VTMLRIDCRVHRRSRHRILPHVGCWADAHAHVSFIVVSLFGVLDNLRGRSGIVDRESCRHAVSDATKQDAPPLGQRGPFQ
jgi:hypothetical protein